MKLLIIEDEPGLREAISEALQRDSYLADGIDNAEDGLDMVRTGIYDLIILDIMLPRIDGLEFLRIIRNMHIDTPVILLTAISQLSYKLEGLNSGADDYITKPFEMEELLARIRTVLRRQDAASTAGSRSIIIGDLVLNPLNNSISKAGNDRSVQLAKKEFHILEYLMRNAGIILSREQITLKVWGYDSNAEYNNVDVYISYIRKKLSFLGVAVQIKAVRGLGYKIIEEAEND